MGKIYVVGSQKGGVGKTTSVFNLAYFLQKMGKKVLAVDFDVQASLTACYGIEDTGNLKHTIGHLLMAEIEDMELPAPEEYIRTKDGVDFIPSSPFLSVADAKLRIEMGSEKMLSGILEPLRDKYDYILIDTGPSLGTLNINALVAADKVVIVTDPQFLAMMGVQDFLRTIAKTKRRLNPKLEIAGILFTMVTRTNLSKVLTNQTAESLQGQVRVFHTRIPNTVKVGESISYRNHPFRLYEGDRLEDMAESIKEHGILTPVIVREASGGYEMLAGHNRQRAGKLAGLKEIPALIKTGLTDEDAYVYVIETNVMQRGFVELLPSEKAAVLADRYKKVSSQGKRNDILLEIEKLNSRDMEGTCGHDVHKLKNRDAIGEEYGMTGRNIARYMRVHQLVQPLKHQLDEGNLSLVAAVDLSYLSGEEQGIVSGLAEQGSIKLDVKTARTIRDMAGEVSEEKLLENLGSRKKKNAASVKTIKLPADVYAKYFSGTKSEDVLEIIEEALSAWFERERDRG